ncbi:MAG: SAM-dependent methyltransferase [Nitrospirota bacterium]
MLKEKIIRRIKEEGPITFEQFMGMALYDPEFGYYSASPVRIGREGDFYTTSHLHPVFGAMIGKQIEEMWEIMGRPHDFKVIEMGAGEGYLCRDMLEFLKDREFYDSLQYIIIEINQELLSNQKRILSGFSEKIRWCNSLTEMSYVVGCIFSNELLDAFPVHLIQMEEEMKEIYVVFDGKDLKEKSGTLSRHEISEYFKDIAVEFEEGYRTEVNLHLRGWLKDINMVLREGFIFTIDYGHSDREYFSEDRNRGTLMCYYKHQVNEDPYKNIGKQDITAHVNFSSVKKWGEEIGFRTIGYCSQGMFLLSLGLDAEIEKLASGSKDYLFEIARIKKIIMPQGMGESHKVLVQYKGNKCFKLKGFKMSDRVHTL